MTFYVAQEVLLNVDWLAIPAGAQGTIIETDNTLRTLTILFPGNPIVELDYDDAVELLTIC